MISEERYGGAESEDPMLHVRTTIGFVLIAIGLVIALWTFSNTYRMFTKPEQLEVFNRVVSTNPESMEMELEGSKVLLPIAAFQFMAYTVGCSLLFVAGIIGLGLVSSGAAMLGGISRRFELRVDRKIEILRKKMDEVKEALEKKGEKSG
jgi:uncharacterized membrane protein